MMQKYTGRKPNYIKKERNKTTTHSNTIVTTERKRMVIIS
jgi:hypothetical protein